MNRPVILPVLSGSCLLATNGVVQMFGSFHAKRCGWAILNLLLSIGNTSPSAYAPGGSNLLLPNLNKHCLLT